MIFQNCHKKYFPFVSLGKGSSHGRILDIFLPGLKHSKVENPFYISASTSILDPNKTVLILIRQGCSPASPYGVYAYGNNPMTRIMIKDMNKEQKLVTLKNLSATDLKDELLPMFKFFTYNRHDITLFDKTTSWKF